MKTRILFAATALSAIAACGGGTVSTDDDGGGGGTDAARSGDGGTLADAGMSADAGLPAATCVDRGATLPTRAGDTIRVSPAGPGKVTVNGTTRTLRQVVSSANAGDTILLESGTYTFDEAATGSYTGLYFTTPDVTMRSASGNPSDVVLDSAYADHGGSTGLITIDASGVVLANMTLRRAIFHLVHLWANGDGAILHNLRLLDAGQQFVKGSPASGTLDDVEVSCTQFIMTAAGRDNVWGYGAQDGYTRCYTGGIDTHDGRNWHVHDSYFEGIYCDATGVPRPAHGKKGSLRDNMTYQGGLSEYAIHQWDSEQGSNHIIERNHIVNCARGIEIGMSARVYGGVIRNNMIFSGHPASAEHDVAIMLERAQGTLVANNTIYYADTNGYPASIEYRWDTTSGVTLVNNLSNRNLRARNGATGTLDRNVVNAAAGWFAGATTGDLHLAACTESSVVGAGQALGAVTDDFDAEPRQGGNDVGADQCQP